MADVAYRVPIAKRDDSKRRVYGYALTADVVDSQGDLITKEELEEAVADYVLNSGDMGTQHETSGMGRLICSVVLTPEIREVIGAPPGPTQWLVGYQVTDNEAWARIASGELQEFSIEGDGVRTPLEVESEFGEAA